MSANLTPDQRTLLDKTILLSFKALGRSPLKLADIASHVVAILEKTLAGGTYEFYRWCDAAMQRLKREGRVELVRGAGGGWKLGSGRSKPEKPKSRPAKTATAKKPAPPKKASAKPSGSYAPFKIDEIGESVRLSFFDWAWLEKQHGSIEIDGYYMNGPGVEGLVRAVMFANKIASNGVEGDSEGDACLLYFTSVPAATRVA